MGEFDAARKSSERIRSRRIDVDDRGVEHGGDVVGPAVADQTVAERGLTQVHHFGVEDDGLLALLAVGRMESEVVSVVGAGAARIDGVVDEVVRRHGAGELHGHEEGHPVLLFGVRITVEVLRVIDVAGDDDFGVAVGVESPVHRVPLEARFCTRVGVGAVQMESTGLHSRAVDVVMQGGEAPVPNPVDRLDQRELVGVVGACSVEDRGTGGHGMPLILGHDGLVVSFAGVPVGSHFGPGRGSIVFDEGGQRSLVVPVRGGVLVEGIGRSGHEVADVRDIQYVRPHVVVRSIGVVERVDGVRPVRGDRRLARIGHINFHQHRHALLVELDPRNSTEPPGEGQFAIAVESVDQDQALFGRIGCHVLLDFRRGQHSTGVEVEGHHDAPCCRTGHAGRDADQDAGFIPDVHHVGRAPPGLLRIILLPVDGAIGLDAGDPHCGQAVLAGSVGDGRGHKHVLRAILDFRRGGVHDVVGLDQHIVQLSVGRVGHHQGQSD